jgi:cell division protein FtsW
MIRGLQSKGAYLMLVAVLGLVVLGLVMLYSTSAFAQDSHGNPTFFLRRQAMWLGVGVILAVAAALVDYHQWQRITPWLFGVSFVLLLLCFIPPIGMRINGSARWINLGVASFQPSELGKLSAVCGLAWWFARDDVDARSFIRGFLAPCGIAGSLMLLIAPEVDIGTTSLIGATLLALMFVAGTRLFYIVPVVMAGLGAIWFAATHIGERLGRVMAFMDLERFREGAGLQQYQALIAFGSGGVEGLGLGNGRQKMAYLPFAHTDFIFPMVGEELGLRFTLLVVACYVTVLVCGAMIAVHSRDRYGMLMGFGLVVILSLQAALNIGVTTALLPNKGLPLPFISYGGSNLAFCLLCMGILVSIHRRGFTEKEVKTSQRLNLRLRARTQNKVVRI